VRELEDLKQKIAGNEYTEINGEALVKMPDIMKRVCRSKDGV
jgi:hypothetical protein